MIKIKYPKTAKPINLKKSNHKEMSLLNIEEENIYSKTFSNFSKERGFFQKHLQGQNNYLNLLETNLDSPFSNSSIKTSEQNKYFFNKNMEKEKDNIQEVTEIKEKEESHRKQEHEEAEELLDLI